jgi:hypothetical protein
VLKFFPQFTSSVLNQRRNTIAHTLSMDKIDEKMAQLKENYLASLTEKQAEV